MISIPRYRARLSQLSGEAYNLPVDTIYYIESATNLYLNDEVRRKLPMIEEYLSDHRSEGSLFPYRFRYVSRCDVVAIEQLLQLHPEIEGDHLFSRAYREAHDRLRARFDCGEMVSLTAMQADDRFADGFICHLLPSEINDDNTQGFYSIDVSELTPDWVLEVLTEYVRTLDEYNRAVLLGRMDYGQVGQVEQKAIPKYDSSYYGRTREMLAPYGEHHVSCSIRLEEPQPPTPGADSGIRFSVSASEKKRKAKEEKPELPEESGMAEEMREERKLSPRARLERARELLKKREEEERKKRKPEPPEDYRYMVPGLLEEEEERPIPKDRYMLDRNLDLCDAALRPSASACIIRSPEDKLNDELRMKAEAIRRQIEELQRQNGINIWSEMLYAQIIQQLRGEQPVPVSRLRLDPQFRILLPEYDIEIPLSTLPKALYVLFLRHPEGIDRYDLESYREELRTIYLTLSGRDDVTAMNRSIDDLVTPGSDSLNQKVSRINAAFRNRLATDVAQPYLIQGPRGEKKRVEVAGSVELPDELRF